MGNTAIARHDFSGGLMIHSFPAYPVDWNMERFSERLRQLREARNISQTRLAELLNVLPRVYNRWERGVAIPHWSTIVKIADILNVSLDDLAERRDPKESDAATKARNPELHRLYQEADQLSDKDQKALIIVLDSFVKLSYVTRAIAR
jgi:transcriptional regulator with XRE-family HTH domain